MRFHPNKDGSSPFEGTGLIDYTDIVDRWHTKILGEKGHANHPPANDNDIVPGNM